MGPEIVTRETYKCQMYHVMTDAWQLFARDTRQQAEHLAHEYMRGNPHGWVDVLDPAGITVMKLRRG